MKVYKVVFGLNKFRYLFEVMAYDKHLQNSSYIHPRKCSFYITRSYTLKSGFEFAKRTLRENYL